MEYKKLGDIATYINGYAFKPEQRGSEGLPIIRIQDLTGNAYDLGYYNGDYPNKIELNDGDVLISWSASLGVYLWNRGKALLNQHIFKVVFDKVEIDKFYFMYAVEYNLDKMSLKTHGATMKHITKKDFDNVVIPYPDLDYQKEISYRLTSLKGIIKKYQKQLDLLDELIKARFVEMFGTIYDKKFDMKTLPDIVSSNKNSIKRGPFGGALKKEDFLEDGYMVYEQRHAIHEDFEYAKYYVSPEKYESMIGFKVVPGDLIISCSGTLGRIAEVPMGAKEGIINQALLKISLNKDIMNNQFFIYQFRCKEIQDMLFGISRGSGIANMPSMNEVKAFKFICPPLELQNQFASFVKEIDKSRLLSNHSLFLIKSIIF